MKNSILVLIAFLFFQINPFAQDGWFLLFISAIYAQLRLVGGIDFLNRYQATFYRKITAA